MIDDTEREPDDAQPWLDWLDKVEKEFDPWQSACDNIDKAYADLDLLRNMDRDREMQIFWSNEQILKTSIYARPPVPVVVPKFKDRRPVYRTASELLERCCISSFDLGEIDQVMLSLRDDLSLNGRGAAWVSYESDDDGERVCYEALDRRDFRMDNARKWAEVDKVAKRAWLTKDEMRERFKDAADHVSYSGASIDDRSRYAGQVNYGKTPVWEIWCKSEKTVVWVAEGCQDVLDRQDPYLKLQGFFPCPRPAFATLRRGTMVPIPDMLIYKDQLEEINSLTRRIFALSDAIKVRGFYAGGSDLGAAIERAILMDDDGQLLVPIPNMQSLVAGSGGQPIIWLPVDMLATTISGLVELRRQVIDDVYQIIGLSDIMRGATQAEETLGAQQLKQQNGSYRVRDKQNELVRVARDLTRIGAEIMAEEFSKKTILDMSQMELPTDAEIKKQIKALEDQGKVALQGLEDEARRLAAQAQAQGQQPDPQQVMQQLEQRQQQILAPIEEQLGRLQNAVTVEAVMAFIRDQKLRPFQLDIETDSTIYPDEIAEKASRVEFLGAFQSAMGVVQQASMMGPEAVALAGGVFKFALAPYRVGRELDGLIDDLVDKAPEIAERMAAQQAGGEGEDMAAANMALAQAEMRKAEAAVAKVEADTQGKMQDMQLRAAEAQTKAQQDQQRFALEVQKSQGTVEETAARIEKIYSEIQLAQQKLGLDAHREQREDVKAAADIQSRQQDQAMKAQGMQQDAQFRAQDGQRADRQLSAAEIAAQMKGQDNGKA